MTLPCKRIIENGGFETIMLTNTVIAAGPDGILSDKTIDTPKSQLETLSRMPGFSIGCGKNTTSTSGTKTMTVNGKTRGYTLRIPIGYDSKKPYRLIFALHWLSGTMSDVSTGGTSGQAWAYYGLQDKAAESAIFIAPQGLNNGWANTGGEDITFIDQMRTTVENDLCIDQSQRFSVGFSYGAAMSYSLACSRGKEFRAVAALSGGPLSGCEGGNDSVAYLGIHGGSDRVLPIALGRELRDRFVRNNGCKNTTTPEPAVGSGTHVKTSYEGCKSEFPVTWIAFDGEHSPIPVDGGPVDGAKSWTPGEIWKFFSQFG